ncbi:MAG: proline dehydrogenase family protein [Elusimicrobia bacterium]|nr:proline dehydrogenase family protein [Elusimicrobiota bacterium]
MLTFLASRFVAGEGVHEAVEAVCRLNADGLLATVNYLGEAVQTRAQAKAATQEYFLLLRKIAEAEADSNISVKLTQLGLRFDESLCEQNLVRILEEASKLNNFVRIDMEGSFYTQKTLDIFRRIFTQYSNVGVVIQSYLRRSQKDVRELNRIRARIRLCKGAYRESAEAAFQLREEANHNYDVLMQLLLAHGNYPALATHDDARIQAAKDFAKEHEIAPDQFEFQMLYGLRQKLWPKLVKEGYRLRIYVPYGTHWLSYFYRRLTERKENWMFVLRSLVRG